ncbi:MAG: TRAP transporter large permease subunit, partial [Caulobacterales bacterium]|nr:TRAP transporter large permease subunit [Caulobacterales bacterium]
FVFMGVMLEKSKVAEELLDTMTALFGPLRGGLGISVVLVGALLAASTGIVGATVVTMGLLSLPTMLRRGYAPALATGSIAAAGTLGQIIPPSIVLVLLGDVMANAYQKAQLDQGVFAPDTVSVGDLFAGALVPGLVLVGLYIAYQVFVAITRPGDAPAAPPEERAGADFGSLLQAVAPPLILIIAVLGSILGGLATPTEAAAIGAVGATFVAGARRGDATSPFRWTKALVYAGAGAAALLIALASVVDVRLGRDSASAGQSLAILLALALSALAAAGLAAAVHRLWASRCMHEVVRDTGRVTSMVFVILVGATVFSLVFRGLGGDELVEEVLAGASSGVLAGVAGLFGLIGLSETGAAIASSTAGQVTVGVVIVMVVMFLLGFFLDFIEITFVVVPLVAPPLLALGVDPVWLGVMMAINLQTSFLTPPFGFALFYLRGVAPQSVSTGQIYR